MKALFKVAGLILAAIFAVSMFASASASAAWEQCGTEKASAAKSKYPEHQCTTASGAGGWAWQTAPGSENVRGRGSLRLADTRLGVEIECYGEGEGTLSKVEKVTIIDCRTIKGCEANTISGGVVDLPWKVEQFDTEGKKLSVVEEEGTNGGPGWTFTCSILKVKDTDSCKAVGPESQELLNVNSGAGGLLVLATFQRLRKQTCTLGGSGSGEVAGSLAIFKANGWGLRVA
jgi:hypothetical protein